MLMELGRGKLIMEVKEIETALDEATIDIPIGGRGFLIRDRARGSVLRWSNIKGEVSKASDADPPGKYWTVGSEEPYGGILGMRMSDNRSELLRDETLPEQEDGTVLESRYYVTSEDGDTTIEVIIVPGY